MATCCLHFTYSCTHRRLRCARRRRAPALAVHVSPVIDTMVLTRLDAAVALERGQVESAMQGQPMQFGTAHEDILNQLGRDLRDWRLRHSCNRATMVRHLPITLDQLLCLENGIAQPGDLAAWQLIAIRAVLGP